MPNNKLTAIQRMLPGVIALIILAFYWGPEYFYPWLFEILLFYAGYFFLIRILILTIINREFNKDHLKPMVLGIAAIFISIILLLQTPEEIIINFLRATAIFSVIYISFEYIREKIK
jgi:cation transport ATPase